MRKLIIVSLILVINHAFAQIKPANKEQIEDFLNSKTCVVLDGNEFSAFNIEMKEAMDSVWHITPYEFITKDVFEKRRKSKRYSFIMLTEAVLNEGMKMNKYNILNFVLGIDKEHINYMPDLGSIPLSYVGAKESGYLYKLEGFLRFMQSHVEQSLETGVTLKNLYGICSKDIQNYELWIMKDQLAKKVNEEKKIQMYYPHPVKLVQIGELKEAIKTGKHGVAFLHLIQPVDPDKPFMNCWKFVIAIGNGKLLYSGGHITGAGNEPKFLKDDFKKIMECQGK